MAELYFPFPSSGGDRMVGVETYERMLGSIFTQGVYPRGEMLAVTAAGGMSVTLHTGSAILVRDESRASLYHNTTPVTLTLVVADGVAERIDSVVLRRDNAARLISVKVIQGVSASSAVPIDPVRNDDLWDIVLCHIHVRAGAAEITQADIEDQRMNNDLCGVVSSLAQLDSARFYEQQTALFNEWFDAIQTTLDGDIAGNLANGVQALERHTEGVRCEIVNEPYTILASGWRENASELRKEYVIEHEAIRADTFTRIVLPNELAGKINLAGLPRPGDGSWLLYTTDVAPAQDITVQLIIEEVRFLE